MTCVKISLSLQITFNRLPQKSNCFGVLMVQRWIINVLELIQHHEIVSQTAMKFSKSCYFQAQLPKGYTFVKITSPKRYLANHLDNEYGFPLVTYCEGDFSRVRLSQHGMVEEIVVVTQKI